VILRKTDAERVRSRFLPGHWRLARHLLPFFILGLLGGCGTTHAATIPTQQSPTPSASPFHATVQTFDRVFTLTLTISPNRSGINRFTMQVIDRAGKPAEHVVITLYTTMQDMFMGTDSVVLQTDGPGQFSATSNVLSMGGRWAIGITIQTADHVIHKAGVMFTIPL
jgi:hypothetical protein